MSKSSRHGNNVDIYDARKRLLTRSTCLRIELSVFFGIEADAVTLMGLDEGMGDFAGIATVEEAGMLRETTGIRDERVRVLEGRAEME